MKTFPFLIVALFGAAGLLTSQAAVAQEEEEEAADLSSYSVGTPRPAIDPKDVKIERSKLENSFKLDIGKPKISGISITKPKFEVITPPAPETASADATRTATASPGAVGSTYPATGETRPVQPLSMQPPKYPRDAFRRRQEGFVVIEFTINAQGRTEDVTVVDAQPRGAFEREARRAVADWTFQPAMENGRPVPQRIRHTLEFKLSR
ncbi:MAG TPA: energy transducer TonB [Gammaproteobacteria bacterium]